MTETTYRLKLDDDFLSFEDHGDCYILCPTDRYDSIPASFKTEEGAIATICDDFYFHHGYGSIRDNSSAKERLEKIQIIKVVTTVEEEPVRVNLYVPTNIEIHNWYVAAKGDTGLRIYLKSQCPGWEELDSYRRKQFFDDDGYEFACHYDRIKGYNDWVAAGKPTLPSKSERIAKFREEAAKGGKKNG